MDVYFLRVMQVRKKGTKKAARLDCEQESECLNFSQRIEILPMVVTE
jgi:hypothetical protein